MDFSHLIHTLNGFWIERGCLLAQPYDLEKGAGTMNPHTFLRCLGPKPWNVCYAEPSRRPTDGRYGKNPNRLQHYYQYQVILKPSPLDVQSMYLDSLKAIGIDPKEHDIRFVEDNWESPTLGAWGVGWEVWCDGMEVTQFTYFQQVGGMDCNPVSVELTYGLERLAMYIQKKDSVYDVVWTEKPTTGPAILYGDIHLATEIENSTYNFEVSNVDYLLGCYNGHEAEARRCLEKKLVIPAYDLTLKCSHTFNMLDARGAISVSERQNYIGKIRTLAAEVAKQYVEKYCG